MKSLISVAMGNYNCAQYIEEAIDSIRAQTYSEWELIIVDDCSNDESVEKILNYNDSRIKLIRSEKNEGLAISLNKAFAQANGDYIARLDPDDIAFPRRFEIQLDYLNNNKNVCVCGSNMELFGEVNGYVTKLPVESERLMSNIPFCSPLPHSSWMIKRSGFENAPLYSQEYRSSQDYEFMYRLWLENKRIACIKEPLVKYRVRNDSISGKNKKYRDPNTIKVQKAVLKQMGIEVSDQDIDDLNFDYGSGKGKFKEYFRYINMCNKLVKINRGNAFFSQSQLKTIIFKKSIVNGLRVVGMQK